MAQPKYLQWLMEAYFEPKLGRDRIYPAYTAEDYELAEKQAAEYKARLESEQLQTAPDRKTDKELPIYEFSLDQSPQSIAFEQFGADTKRESNRGKLSIREKRAQRDIIYYS